MSDLFGYTPAKPAFVDIRNQRPSTAEQKALLCDELRKLLAHIPAGINAASVNTVRSWRLHHASAKKTLASPRSTVNDLTSAINQMKSFK